MLEIDNNEIVEGDDKANEIVKILFKSKKLKNEKFEKLTYIEVIKSIFF